MVAEGQSSCSSEEAGYHLHMPIEIDEGDGGEKESLIIPTTQNLLKPRNNELSLAFAGQVHVFNEVTPEKVQAVLFLLGGGQIPTSVPTADLPFQNNRGVEEATADLPFQNNRGVEEATKRSDLSGRMASLARFRQKRKERSFEQKVGYHCRKEVAHRLHSKMEFVSLWGESNMEGQDSTSSWDSSHNCFQDNSMPHSDIVTKGPHSNVNHTEPLEKRPTYEQKCENCGIDVNFTPVMRRGPAGPRSLCNACGLTWANKGTLRDLTKGGQHVSFNHNVSEISSESEGITVGTENPSAKDQQKTPEDLTKWVPGGDDNLAASLDEQSGQELLVTQSLWEEVSAESNFWDLQ